MPCTIASGSSASSSAQASTSSSSGASNSRLISETAWSYTRSSSHKENTTASPQSSPTQTFITAIETHANDLRKPIDGTRYNVSAAVRELGTETLKNQEALKKELLRLEEELNFLDARVVFLESVIQNLISRNPSQTRLNAVQEELKTTYKDHKSKVTSVTKCLKSVETKNRPNSGVNTGSSQDTSNSAQHSPVVCFLELQGPMIFTLRISPRQQNGSKKRKT